MRKVLIGLLTILLAATLVPAPSNAVTGDYLDGVQASGDQWFVYASERALDGEHSMLALQPGAVEVGGTRGQWVNCKDANDPNCTTPSALSSIIAWSILPSCQATSHEICIESFELANLTEEFAAAKYLEESPPRTGFPGNLEKNLLDGRGVPLYESQNLDNVAGSKTFGVAIKVTQFWDSKTSKFVAHGLEVAIIPFFTTSPSLAARCTFTYGGLCGAATSFKLDSRVRLTFRLPNTVGGWFSGRMKDPTLSVDKYSATANKIVVQSQPVDVAALGLVKSRPTFTLVENMWVENNGRGFMKNFTYTGANSWQENIFPFIENYRSQVNDTAIGTDTVWKLRTVPTGFGSGCLSDTSKVYGLVTTNALGYEPESPKFDGGFLDYRVAGLHYLPGGKDLVIGTYDLVMSSEAARCLYGFSKAPVSATVTVVGSGGAENIATTVVSEKNGWLKLSAYGFTFSEKEIKVRVTQPQTKTLSRFLGSKAALTGQQKNEIRNLVGAMSTNENLTCTGYRLAGQPQAQNVLVKTRARLACDFAKTLNPNLVVTVETKITTSPSTNGRVILASR